MFTYSCSHNNYVLSFHTNVPQNNVHLVDLTNSSSINRHVPIFAHKSSLAESKVLCARIYVIDEVSTCTYASYIALERAGRSSICRWKLVTASFHSGHRHWKICRRYPTTDTGHLLRYWRKFVVPKVSYSAIVLYTMSTFKLIPNSIAYSCSCLCKKNKNGHGNGHGQGYGFGHGHGYGRDTVCPSLRSKYVYTVSNTVKTIF
jgi:hypothetical protein